MLLTAIQPIQSIEYQIPGEYRLHQQWVEEGGAFFDVEGKAVKAKPELVDLINFLVINEILAPIADATPSIQELNAHLQNPENGVFSKEYKERWEISDSSALQKISRELKEKFAQLGLIHAKIHEEAITVDHAHIFGARVERVEVRTKRTLQRFDCGKLEFEKIFLLGSNRNLMEEEKNYLKQIPLDKGGLTAEECETEADGCQYIWDSNIAKQESRSFLNARARLLNTTKKGSQVQAPEGRRPTTTSTLSHYMCEKEEEPSSIYASVEQPYGRLVNQLKWYVWTNDLTASLDELKDRVQQIDIKADYYEIDDGTKDLIIIQEVAKQIYFFVETLDYISSRIKKESVG